MVAYGLAGGRYAYPEERDLADCIEVVKRRRRDAVADNAVRTPLEESEAGGFEHASIDAVPKAAEALQAF